MAQRSTLSYFVKKKYQGIKDVNVEIQHRLCTVKPGLLNCSVSFAVLGLDLG